MNIVEHEDTKSYIETIRTHVKKLGVSKDNRAYYREVHRIMIHAGILDPKSVDEKIKSKKEGKRSDYKPYPNSPYGKHVKKDENGTSRYSFMLNADGIAKVDEIFTKYITDNSLSPTKSSHNKPVIASAEPLIDEIQKSVSGDVLKVWLKDQGCKIVNEKVGQSFLFILNNIRHTYYYNKNLIVCDTHTPTTPFWFIRDTESILKNTKQDKAIIVKKILYAHWCMEYGNKVETLEWTSPQIKEVKPTPKPQIEEVTIADPSSLNQIGQLMDEISSLKSMISQLSQGAIPIASTPTKRRKEPSLKQSIITQIKSLAPEIPKEKRFKSITLEQIDKETDVKYKKLLQNAYDELERRRLLTAVNRPKKGWKFNFEKKSIELLYRIDDRKPAVFSVRHRFLKPRNGVKEKADKGSGCILPYGLENIDYSFKTIFIAEGAYDSCFLKNCLAQSNWIVPHKMCEVIDIFRDNGFQIIYIPDNFRLGDKGGLKFYEQIATNRDWLAKGDRMFSWDIYGDCDDLNKIAMEYELDEIDPQTIIDHSWGKDEVRANYHLYMIDEDDNQVEWSEFLSAEEIALYVTGEEASDNNSLDKIELPQKQDCFTTNTELEARFDEMEKEQKQADAKREEQKRRWEEFREQEAYEMRRTMQDIYNPQPYFYKTLGITIAPPSLRER